MANPLTFPSKGGFISFYIKGSDGIKYGSEGLIPVSHGEWTHFAFVRSCG